jgi:hypothetical protein
MKSGKQNIVKRYTPNSATPIGANTMFLQICKRYTPFSALHQFIPTLPIIVLKWRQNIFCEIQDSVPLKLKNNVQRPILKHYPPVNTTFEPP